MDKMNVMVIDDLKSIRQALGVILEDDFNVTEAASGPEALQKLEAGDTYMAMLDILMPGMDGLETLRLIKSKFPNVEVCMLTSINDSSVAAKATELGAFDYITKPFDVERVRQAALNMEKVVKTKWWHKNEGFNSLN